MATTIDDIRALRIADYDYPLPDERIAKHPLTQREQCKLLYYKGGEIEERNILGATMLAMNRAIACLKTKPDLALIDGNRNAGIETPSLCVVKGDATCADIAAASILAKVSRDRVMLELAKEYPEYHFEQHKGYGTALHYAALREYGPSPVHRPSFLKKMH